MNANTMSALITYLDRRDETPAQTLRSFEYDRSRREWMARVFRATEAELEIALEDML